MLINLSPRLQAIAEQVLPGARVADVGTDHGYIPIYLVQSGRCAGAVASDVREGPLQSAVRSARALGLEEKIAFRLGDGLEKTAPEEADTIIIAGMGGETIIHILSAAPWTASPGKTLVLQPMSKQGLLRRWLTGNGYAISSEKLVFDGGTVYTLFTARGGESAPLTLAEEHIGQFALVSGEPLLDVYLKDEIAKLRRAIEGASCSTRAADLPRLRELSLLYAQLVMFQERRVRQ